MSQTDLPAALGPETENRDKAEVSSFFGTSHRLVRAVSNPALSGRRAAVAAYWRFRQEQKTRDQLWSVDRYSAQSCGRPRGLIWSNVA
jgi:hypothetical protein